MSKRKPKDSPILIFMDLGNSHLKIIMMTPDGEIQVFIIPHDLTILTPAKFQKAQSRAKYQRNRVQNSASFQKLYKDGAEIFVTVGQEAVEDRNSNKKIGSAKYVRGYFDCILAGVLMQILPAGHDNIILGIGYPPSELSQLEQMVYVLQGDGGVHKVIDLQGDELKYVIRQIVPVDEPIGSLEWYAHNNAQYNPISVSPGDRFIIVDIGGSIGSIGRVMVNSDGTFAPLYNEFSPINNGINDVYSQLRDHLKSIHPEHFTGRDVPLHILKEALSRREVVLSGDIRVDVTEAVIQSLGIIDDVESLYLNDYDGGRFDKGVLLTGGSMIDLYPEFEQIINHANTSPVAEVSEIILANVRGMMLIVVAALIQDGKLPKNYQGVFDAYFKTR